MSTLGVAPRFPRWPSAICWLGVLLPAADLLLGYLLEWYYSPAVYRVAVALYASVVLSEASRADRDALRSCFDPAPGWGFWARAGIALGLLLVSALAVVYLAAWALGVSWPIERLQPADVPEALYRMCVESPLVEEVFYRQALCGALVVWAGPRWAIVGSGVVFAGLHWVYGNASPENQIGGFVLAWMYLRSGTLAVPIAFHAVGNLAGVFGQLLAGHLWPDPVLKGSHL